MYMAHKYVQCKRTLARNPYHQLHRGMLRPSVFASPKVCSDLLTCVTTSVAPCRSPVPFQKSGEVRHRQGLLQSPSIPHYSQPFFIFDFPSPSSTFDSAWKTGGTCTRHLSRGEHVHKTRHLRHLRRLEAETCVNGELRRTAPTPRTLKPLA